MRQARYLVTACFLTIFILWTDLAQGLASPSPLPSIPINSSLPDFGDHPPDLGIFDTANPFERIDTRAIIPQISLALYHLCSFVKPNPCGSYVLRGPWHNGISWGPIYLLFELPKQQPDFLWRWYSHDLLTPSWLKEPKKDPGPMWRMSQLFPFTNQDSALRMRPNARIWPSFTPLQGMMLFLNPDESRYHGTINILEWRF